MEAQLSPAFLTEVKQAVEDARPRPYERDPEKGFTMDIMMMMDMDKVSSLRGEFQRKGRGLSISEFVVVMMRFVQTSPDADENARLRNLPELQLVANLCELFAQIDINGDGSMEWEEFTSFIVDTGLTAKSHQPSSIQLYHHVPWEDASKHSTFIDHVYYFPSSDVVALVENCSPFLKIYNTNCEQIQSIKTPDGFVQCAEHLPKFDQYIIASSDLQFRFYDDDTLRLIKSCHTPTSQNCLKWYPDSPTLFSAGVSGIVYAWDVERMEERHHMGGEARGRVLTRSHDDIVLDLLNLPTLESLASASMDRTIRLWDVHTGKHKQQLDGHAKGVRSLAYSPEYRFLVSAGFDFDALVWNPYVDQLILRLHGHNNSLCGVEIIPDTPQIVTADVDGVFKVWDIRNFACMQTFTAENMGDVKGVVSISAHKRIVAAGKKLTKFDYEKLENPELTDDHPVFAALYNPTSLSFVTAAGKDVKIWDARTGKLLRVYRGLSSSDLTALCLDSRERKLVVGDHDGHVHVFDYLNGAHMKSFAYPETADRAHTAEVTRLRYCGDFMSVISVSWDGCISIHDESDSERGVLLRQLRGGHAADITSLDFSPILSLIASGASDGSLQVWDYEFGRLDGSCIGHVSGVLSLRFLDPFPLLASSDNSGNVCFWGMRPSRFKCKCVYRFRNQHLSPGPPQSASPTHGGSATSVSCLAVHSTRLDELSPGLGVGATPLSAFASFLVLTGDDKGFVSVWNVLPLLLRLEEDLGLGPLERPVECINPRRNLRVDAAGMVRKLKNGPEWAAFAKRDPAAPFFSAGGAPAAGDNPRLAQCLSRWKAHADIVYSIQVVAEPESLVTCSFDRRVRVWTLAGDCLGVLMQGEIEAARRPWRFAVDYDARERRKEAAAEPVMDDIHRMARDNEEEAEGRRRGRRRLRTHTAPDPEDAPEASALEEVARASLPPLAPAAGRVGVGVSGPLPPLRKTPRRMPVTATTAGRSTFLSPRALRLATSGAGGTGSGSRGASPRGASPRGASPC